MNIGANPETISHVWPNGAVVTSELVWDENDIPLICLRIQAPNEEMICDIEFGEQEAMSVINALSTVMMARFDDD